jgi:hypothetical protein
LRELPFRAVVPLYEEKTKRILAQIEADRGENGKKWNQWEGVAKTVRPCKIAINGQIVR